MALAWLGYIDSIVSINDVSGQKVFNQPYDISVDYNLIYVLDAGNNMIQMFENKAPYNFATWLGSYGTLAGQFNNPQGIEIDEKYIYIADTGNNRIQIWDKTYLNWKFKFGQSGSAPSQFNSPQKIAADNNYIYVSDSGNNRLQIFDKAKILLFDNSNAYVTSLSGSAINTSRGVDIDNNYIYLADSKPNNSGSNRIQTFFNKPTAFNYIGQFGSYGTDLNKFNNLSGIFISGNNLYIIDSGNHRIDIYNKTTFNYITSLGTYGTGQGQFNTPTGLHIDDTTNRIYIADTLNNRIQIFSNIGNITSIVPEEVITIDVSSYIRLKEPEVYSDIDFKLRKISGYRDISKVLNESSINQSIFSLLNTSKGERVFNLNYGCNLRQYLFEPMDEFTARNILEEIKLAIAIWEGNRVKIKELNIDINYNDSAYNIVMEYDILNTKKTGHFELILQKV